MKKREIRRRGTERKKEKESETYIFRTTYKKRERDEIKIIINFIYLFSLFLSLFHRIIIIVYYYFWYYFEVDWYFVIVVVDVVVVVRVLIVSFSLFYTNFISLERV